MESREESPEAHLHLHRAVPGAGSRPGSRIEHKEESSAEPRTELRAQFRTGFKTESGGKLKMLSGDLARRGSILLETSRSPDFYLNTKLSEHYSMEHFNASNLTQSREFPLRGSPGERSQASPDSTTPESPRRHRVSPGNPSKVLMSGEASAFSKPPSTAAGSSRRSRTGDHPDSVRDRTAFSRVDDTEISRHKPEQQQQRQQPIVAPRAVLHSPRAFPAAPPAHSGGGFISPSGGGFVGPLLMPRPHSKYSAFDALALRYLYTPPGGEISNNMAAVAALARYQHAVNLMSHSPPLGGVAAGIPGIPHHGPTHGVPGIQYMVPRPPPPPPPAPGSLQHPGIPPCGDGDSQPPPGSSPASLPYYPLPSEKEGEPLDLLPRSLYMNKGGRKGHLCIYCGKFYSRKYGLKIHLRTHTGYKPLKCKVSSLMVNSYQIEIETN